MAEDTNKTIVPPTAESELDAEKKALAEAEAKAVQAQAEADELKAKIAAKEQSIVDREESEIRFNNYVGYGVLSAGVAAIIYAFKSQELCRRRREEDPNLSSSFCSIHILPI